MYACMCMSLSVQETRPKNKVLTIICAMSVSGSFPKEDLLINTDKSHMHVGPMHIHVRIACVLFTYIRAARRP